MTESKEWVQEKQVINNNILLCFLLSFRDWYFQKPGGCMICGLPLSQTQRQGWCEPWQSLSSALVSCPCVWCSQGWFSRESPASTLMWCFGAAVSVFRSVRLLWVWPGVSALAKWAHCKILLRPAALVIGQAVCPIQTRCLALLATSLALTWENLFCLALGKQYV